MRDVVHGDSANRTADEDFGALVEAARAGSQEALGELLEHCRRYLLLVANRELSPCLGAKEAPSDLVQQTCLDAQQNFDRFMGQSQCELLGWLRKILLRQLAHAYRRYAGTHKRAIDREAIHIAPGQEDWELHVAHRTPSPSKVLMAREQQERMWQGLRALPEDLRQVVLWHHRDGLAFEDIAVRMGRSQGAVRKLWTRAIKHLQQQLETDDATC